MPDKIFWRYNLPALLWAVFVLILCGLPGSNFPELTFLEWLKPDKIAHLVLFGMQSFLLIRGFKKQNTYLYLNKNAIPISVLSTILYGALVEVMQSFLFIQRSGDIRDAAANAIGAILGMWTYNKIEKLKQKQKQKETETVRNTNSQ